MDKPRLLQLLEGGSDNRAASRTLMLPHASPTLSPPIRLLQAGYADGALDVGFSEEGRASGVPPVSLSGWFFDVGTRLRVGRPLRRGHFWDLGL